MIRKISRALFRLFVTLVCTVVAGIFGWCLMGWMHRTPNSPQAIYQAALHPPRPKASGGAINGSTMAEVQADLQQNDLEGAFRKIYQLTKSLSDEELEPLRDQIDWQGDAVLGTFIGYRNSSGQEDYHAGRIYTAEVLRAWYAGDHAATMEAIGNLPPYLQGKLPTRLLKALSLVDGKMALQLLGPHVLNLVPAQGLEFVLRPWAERDLEGALAFAQQLPGNQRVGAMEGVLSAMIATDPTRALQMVNAMPEADQREIWFAMADHMAPATVLANYSQLAAAGAKRSLWPALGELSKTNPESAQQWLTAHPEVWTSNQLGNNYFGQERELTQLPNVLELCTTMIGKDPTVDAAIQQQIQTIARRLVDHANSPGQVIALLQTQTNPAVVVPALQGVLSSNSLCFSETAPNIVAYWQQLEQVSPGATAHISIDWLTNAAANPNLTAADLAIYQPVVATLSPQQQTGLFAARPALFNPADAMDLTFQVQDFEARKQYEQRLVETYGQDLPQEITNWIKQLPTEEERTQAAAVWQAKQVQRKP